MLSLYPFSSIFWYCWNYLSCFCFGLNLFGSQSHVLRKLINRDGEMSLLHFFQYFQLSSIIWDYSSKAGIYWLYYNQASFSQPTIDSTAELQHKLAFSLAVIQEQHVDSCWQCWKDGFLGLRYVGYDWKQLIVLSLIGLWNFGLWFMSYCYIWEAFGLLIPFG